MSTKIESADHTFCPWRVRSGQIIRASDATWREPLAWARAADRALRYWHERPYSPRPSRPRVLCDPPIDVFAHWPWSVRELHGCILFTCRSCRKYSTSHHCIECGSPIAVATIDDLRRDLFSLVDATPQLDWVIATTYPADIRRMWPAVSIGSREQADDRNERGELYRRNTWLLVPISTQQEADDKIPALLECRELAPVLAIACDPLLEPLDLSSWLSCGGNVGPCARHRPDWVIVGGEGGRAARPMHPDWARRIRAQCQGAGVPFYFRGWGEWCPDADSGTHWLESREGGEFFELGRDCLAVNDGELMRRAGANRTGRLLDGLEWSEVPTDRPHTTTGRPQK